MRLPGEATWSSGECIRLVGPRSYKISVGSKVYVRNRRQLIPTGKPLVPKEVSDQNGDEDDGSMQPTEKPVDQSLEPDPASSPGVVTTPTLHRSDRIRKAPSWMVDYVTSSSIN